MQIVPLRDGKQVADFLELSLDLAKLFRHKLRFIKRDAVAEFARNPFVGVEMFQAVQCDFAGTSPIVK